MSFRRILIGLIILLNLLGMAGRADATPEISASSAILINGRTGEVLWGKDMHRPLHPASTTKILTTILLLESAVPEEMAKTTRRAAATAGASLYLTEGQEISVSNLLYAIMLQSANDAAMVAAEHVAGSVDAFADMMNQKAIQAGAINSQFANPHGLTDKNHLTTAYDLAMIARYAMTNPEFRKIAGTVRHTMVWPDGEKRTIWNKNAMLSSYDGMLGIKAGYTQEARRTFVGAAERDGLELIAVVLQTGTNELWDETSAVLDYGFRNFTSIRPLTKDEILGTAPVRFGGHVYVKAAADYEFTRHTMAEEVTVELQLKRGIKAPVAAGDVLGEARVLENGELIGNVPVLAAVGVSRAMAATPRFWLSASVAVVAGLRTRKLLRKRKRRKKIIRRKKESGHIARKFR